MNLQNIKQTNSLINPFAERERLWARSSGYCLSLQLYNQYKTDERTVVAYKGDQVEKDLLNKLNIIPYLDLETLGCPKYEQLKEAIVEP